jgi:hypothetical protein
MEISVKNFLIPYDPQPEEISGVRIGQAMLDNDEITAACPVPTVSNSFFSMESSPLTGLNAVSGVRSKGS